MPIHGDSELEGKFDTSRTAREDLTASDLKIYVDAGGKADDTTHAMRELVKAKNLFPGCVCFVNTHIQVPSRLVTRLDM